MSSHEVVISGQHFDASRNAFVYRLPQQMHFRHGEWIVACSQSNFFNSFFNIAASFGNNTIQIQFPSGAADWVTVDYTIPDGYYTTSAFNALLSKAAYENGLYTAAGSITTRYVDLAVSSYQYANVLQLFPIPLDTAPPGNAAWLTNTGTARSPKVVYSAALGKLFGFSAGTYGDGGAAQQAITSDLVPQIDAVSSVVITCNLVRNVGLSNPIDFLYSQSLGGTAFGKLCTSPQHQPLFNSCVAGSVQEIILRLYDQDMSQLNLHDTNALFQLTFKQV
jgi:hypothetical protein